METGSNAVAERFGASERELLERHVPLLRYDKQAPHRCISVAAFTGGPAGLPDPDDPRPQLDGPERPLEAENRFQADPAHAERAYGAVRADEGGVWLQYWFFYLYNPNNFLGFARHEGDWELVQVGLSGDGEPLRATYAQHGFGDALEWTQAETVPGPVGERPVVYVAPLSNACYPYAGRFPYIGGVDAPRGDGREVTPVVEPFGPWNEWPGRWGNSKGVLRGLLGGTSPPSPGRQGVRWLTPSGFHARQQRPSLGRWYRRTLAVVTSTRPPQMPRIAARAAPSQIVVSYDVGGRYPMQPTAVYASVHDATVPERVLGYARGRVPPSGRGELRVRVPGEDRDAFVRVSSIDRRAQRSAPAEAAVG